MMKTPANRWLDAFFEHYYRRRPVNATFIGMHGYDGMLPDYGPAALDASLAEMRVLLEPVERGHLAPPRDMYEQIDVLLARDYLRIQVWEHSSSHFQRGNPCVYTGEAIFGVIGLLVRNFAPFPERVAAARQRLQAIPSFLAQGRANVRAAPRAWVARAIDECVGAEQLLSDGLRILAERHRELDGEFLEAARSAREAFTEHRRHLQGDGLTASHERYGVGRDAFDFLLATGHHLDMTTWELEEHARRRLAELTSELERQAAELDPTRTSADIMASLARDHPATEAYLPAFEREWSRARGAAVAHNLVTWPEAPLIFEPIPDWARSAAPHLYFLNYRAPAPFDRGVVQRHLVPPVDATMTDGEREQTLRAVNATQIRLNHVVHHAGLGHHVQNYYACRSRSRIGQIAAVDCASRIALFSAGTLCEGWACYATDLMEEIGYLTPTERVAQAHSRVRMATRAVVDAGIHGGTLTLADAESLYIVEAGMTRAAAHAEVVKNTMFPGAALIYLLGADAIHSLRAELTRGQGASFDLCRFHNDLLSYGSIPVTLVAQAMRGEPLDVPRTR